MAFQRIGFYQFRNLQDAEFSVDAPDVFLIGENGQGKTNVLEAVYLLCYGASFRVRNSALFLRHGCSEAAVRGVAGLDDGSTHRIQLSVASGERRISVDGTQVSDRKEIVRNLPCIVFCHGDIAFVTGSPAEQRWFFNQTLSLYDELFIDVLRRYSRILRNRNQCLKSDETPMLDIYDEQLAETGLELQRKRSAAVEAFDQTFAELFHTISGFQQPLRIRYYPSWRDMEDKDEVVGYLASRREIDLRFRTTTSGPHRDRFGYMMDDREFTQTASTGQVRLVSLVLRVAQSVFFSNRSRRRPILLLDDVMLELDPVRRGRFLEALPEYAQAFFTFLPDEQFSPYVKSDTLVYRVERGALHHGEGRKPS